MILLHQIWVSKLCYKSDLLPYEWGTEKSKQKRSFSSEKKCYLINPWTLDRWKHCHYKLHQCGTIDPWIKSHFIHCTGVRNTTNAFTHYIIPSQLQAMSLIHELGNRIVCKLRKYLTKEFRGHFFVLTSIKACELRQFKSVRGCQTIFEIKIVPHF